MSKEFWLFKYDEGDSLHVREITYPQAGDIRAIEYSAYEELKKENEQLRAYNDNSMVNKRNIGDIIMENHKLLETIAMLRRRESDLCEEIQKIEKTSHDLCLENGLLHSRIDKLRSALDNIKTGMDYINNKVPDTEFWIQHNEVVEDIRKALELDDKMKGAE